VLKFLSRPCRRKTRPQQRGGNAAGLTIGRREQLGSMIVLPVVMSVPGLSHTFRACTMPAQLARYS